LRLQLRFSVPIGDVSRIDGIFEVVQLTELVGNLGENKSDGTSNGFLSIRDDALNRYLKLR
jgi:hypothetical protein